jgi:hypothetical protein
MAFEPKHSDLLGRFADIHGLPNQDAEHARAWTKSLAEQFRYTFPDEGWGTKRAGEGRPPSTDVICRPELPIRLMGYDVVISAASPDAALNLTPEGEDISDQVFIQVDPVNHLNSAHATGLQGSLFWAWAGYKNFQVQFEENCDVYRNEMGCDSIRWFFTLGGNGLRGDDPWSIVGARFSDPNHYDVCMRVMNTLKKFGMKSHLVLCGGLNPDGTCGEMYKTEAQRDAIVDRAAIFIHNHIDDFTVVEIWNEYLVNGAQRSWLRHMARRLRNQLPAGFPITLSSPDCVMGGNATEAMVVEEINGMYGDDSGANTFTMHSTRPNHMPWNPETIRHLVTMGIIDGEPRGPGASGDGGNPDLFCDPVVLGGDYQTAIYGDALTYDYHSMPGVWGGHCDPRWNGQNQYANIWNVPNWSEIAKVMKSVRMTGNIPDVPNGGNGEHMAKYPYPDEPTYWKDFEEKTAALFKKAGRTVPAEALQSSRYFARTAWDLADYLTPEDSKEKHLKEMAVELGVEYP